MPTNASRKRGRRTNTLRASQAGLELLNQRRREKQLTQRATVLIEVAGSEMTLNRFWRGEEPITGEVFKAICQYLGVNWQTVLALPTRIDLTAAPEIDLKGRDRELEQLKQWINGKCRLIAIFGMGGVGKTTLAVSLAQKLADQDEFEVVLWRSLKDAPLPSVFLEDLLSSLLNETLSEVPETVEAQIERLFKYLKQHRCLIILDNTESILQGGDLVGQYRPGYEAYGQALRRVGEDTDHRSCILLTSREKSREFGLLEGRGLSVRCLQLLGLNDNDTQAMLEEFNLRGSEADWCDLISSYGGNPLAMRLVAATIRDEFSGDIHPFLQLFSEGSVFLGDLQWLLDEQFQRLTPLERSLMYWLAIARDRVSLEQLQGYLVPPVPKPEILLTSLRSLVQRSLVERMEGAYTLQPVVMEYVANQWIQQVCQGLQHNNLELLNSHALVQATAKDYIRESQIRLIVRPVQEQVGTEVQGRLAGILDTLRQSFSQKPGYASGNLLNLMIQLDIDLTGLDFSQLHIWQAYLRQVSLHQVNFAGAHFHQTVFSERIGNTLNLAFHPDAQTLATVDDKGWLYLWDLEADRQILAIRAHLEWVFALAFNPAGDQIATAGLDGLIKLWNWNGQQLTLERSLPGHPIGVAAVAFSPDGFVLASTSADRTVKLWQVQTGQLSHTLEGHEALVRTVAFSQDGQWVISGGWDHTIRIWDRETGACLRILTGHTQAVEAIVPIALPAIPQGLVSGSYDHTVRVWDLQTGTCVRSMSGHRDRICTIACTAIAPEDSGSETPGMLIASAGDDQTIRLWNAESGECVRTLVTGKHRVWAAAFDPTGRFLVSGSNDRLLQLWDTQSGRCWKTIQGDENLATPFGFNADNTVLYTFSFRDCQLRHWDCQTAVCLKVLSLETTASMQARLSPDGRIVAIAALDHTVRLFDVEDGSCLRILRGHQGWVRTVVFSPTNQWLASGSGDGTIRIWDLSTGECAAVLTGHINPVQALAVSPDGTLLASGSWDQTVQLWQIETGQRLAILTGHTRRIEDLVFGLDGNTLFSGALDGQIRTWSLETQQCINCWQLEDGIVCLSLSPNGQLLASGMYQGQVQVRQLTDSQSWLTLEGSLIYGLVTFAADNRTLATRGAQGHCQLWDVTTGQCWQTLQIPRLYEGLNVARATGLTVAQQETLQALGAVGVNPAIATDMPGE